MISRVVVQLGFPIDSAPSWLAPLLVLLGVEFVLIWHLEQSITVVANQKPNQQSNDKITIPTRDYKLLISGLTFGILLSAIAVIQKYQISSIYAIFLLFCGRLIEGVSTIRFYKKISRFIQSREWGGDFRAKMRHKLTILFIVVLGFYLIGYAIIYGSYFRTLGYTIQVVWTMTALFVTAAGLQWKLRPVRENFDRKLIIGVVLFVTGAELFSFDFIGQIVAIIVSSVGYSIGFWFAGAILIRTQEEPVVMALKYRIRDIRIWFRN